jgi:hypothetical protein
MDASDLRIALFSGNYNYVRDGANQALNRSSISAAPGGGGAYLLADREEAGIAAQGEIVHIPAVPFPRAAPNIVRRS